MKLRLGVVGLACVGLCWSAVAAADEQPECGPQLEQVPRDGSTISVLNPWLSYSGSTVYGGVAETTGDDVTISGVSDVERRDIDATSHVGLRPDLKSGERYEWRIGTGPQASFSVDDQARPDETAPTMGDTDVEASLELMVYEEFPVIFRHWTVSFPAGVDDATSPENMRYLLEFEWDDGGEAESSSMVVTPSIEMAARDRIEIELGGRSDLCNHGEPNLPLTSHAKLSVRAIDLAGNLSETAATGEFDGVSPDKLARAHEEFNEVIANLGGDEDGPTTDEVAAQMDEEGDDADDNGGCSATGGAPKNSLWVLFVVGLMARWPRLNRGE